MFQSLIINPVKIIIVNWNFLDSTFHKVTQSVVDSFTSSFSFSASSFSAFVNNSCRWSSVSWRCSCVQLSQGAGPCCDSGDFKMKDFYRKKEERKKENNQSIWFYPKLQYMYKINAILSCFQIQLHYHLTICKVIMT